MVRPGGQSRSPEYTSVAGALSGELGHPGDLAPVLGDRLGLDRRRTAPPAAQAVHEPGGGGEDESEVRIPRASAPPAAADKLLRVRQGGVGVSTRLSGALRSMFTLPMRGGQPRPLGQLISRQAASRPVDGGKAGKAQGCRWPTSG